MLYVCICLWAIPVRVSIIKCNCTAEETWCSLQTQRKTKWRVSAKLIWYLQNIQHRASLGVDLKSRITMTVCIRTPFMQGWCYLKDKNTPGGPRVNWTKNPKMPTADILMCSLLKRQWCPFWSSASRELIGQVSLAFWVSISTWLL